MKKISSNIASVIKIITLAGVIILANGCDSSSSENKDSTDPGSPPPLVIPLGEEVSGVTLAGPISGKKAYKLDNNINLPNCWSDSANWTGSELYYGISRASFTKLAAGQGLVTDAACLLPRVQVNDDYFDIYKAKVINGVWQINYQNIDGINTEAGVSVSGSTMSYTIYEPSGNWDIYLTQQISDNVWDTPVAFEQNSACPEDNPQIYANGSKIIFESSRLDGAGGSCDADPENKSLWFSKLTGSTWSTPVLIPGDPNVGTKNTQPWIDEANGYLYWTADKECACIRRIKWVNDASVGNFETVLTPAIETLSQGTADGKIVFVGEYSHSDEYAFFACAQAAERGDGSDPDLLDGKWDIDLGLCVIPRK